MFFYVPWYLLTNQLFNKKVLIIKNSQIHKTESLKRHKILVAFSIFGRFYFQSTICAIPFCENSAEAVAKESGKFLKLVYLLLEIRKGDRREN